MGGEWDEQKLKATGEGGGVTCHPIPSWGSTHGFPMDPGPMGAPANISGLVGNGMSITRVL